LLLGAALSFGGVSEAIDNVHFRVEKNLDGVQVKRAKDGQENVVANVQGSFAGNAIYKLARLAPADLVSREANLFDFGWKEEERAERTVAEEIALINDSIREQFFKTSLPFGDLIHEKAEKYDVDPALVAAVVEAESQFKSRAKSPVGARGLMQLMPRTGRWMGAQNLYDPEQNVDAGVKYLKYLDKRFDGNLKKTIAAYNAGEGTVKRYGGIPPYRETRTYVKKVLKNYEKRNQQLRDFEQKTAAGTGAGSEETMKETLAAR
jgi:soluble lytic murein transglycosylase-like protein